MRNPLNFNHLETFLCLADSLSYTKASQELQVAQPALSRQIKALEMHFGKQLFIRTKQKVQLTSFGEDLRKQTEGLFFEICNRVDNLNSKSDELTGEIVFATYSEVGEKLFTKAISIFKKEHPKLRIRVLFLKAFEIIQGLKEGKIHIGIISEKIIQENILCYEVYKEEILMVTNSKNSKIDLNEIDRIPMLGYRKDDPLAQWYSKKVLPKSVQKKMYNEMSVNSHKSMTEILVDHDFYSILPYLSIAKEIRDKKLVNIGPKKLSSSLYMIYLDLEYKEEKVKSLAKHLKKYLDNI